MADWAMGQLYTEYPLQDFLIYSPQQIYRIPNGESFANYDKFYLQPLNYELVEFTRPDSNPQPSDHESDFLPARSIGTSLSFDKEGFKKNNRILNIICV